VWIQNQKKKIKLWHWGWMRWRWVIWANLMQFIVIQKHIKFCQIIAYCIWSVISSFSNLNWWCISPSLSRSVEERPWRLRLEMEIKWHSKCNRLYILMLGYFFGFHCVWRFQVHIFNLTPADISRFGVFWVFCDLLLFLSSFSAIHLGDVIA